MIVPDFRIRAATSADQPIIRRFVYRARLNPMGLSWRGFAVVEKQDGEVIGCGQIKRHRDGSAELASLYVQPEYRGQGIAGALITYLQREAGAGLWLTCRSGLTPFYERFGFLEVTDPEAMPRYFQRVWRAFQWFKRWMGEGDYLAVMHWGGGVPAS